MRVLCLVLSDCTCPARRAQLFACGSCVEGFWIGNLALVASFCFDHLIAMYERSTKPVTRGVFSPPKVGGGTGADQRDECVALLAKVHARSSREPRDLRGCIELFAREVLMFTACPRPSETLSDSRWCLGLLVRIDEHEKLGRVRGATRGNQRGFR